MVLSCRHILPRYPPGDLSDGKSRIWVIFTVIIDNIGDSKVEKRVMVRRLLRTAYMGRLD